MAKSFSVAWLSQSSQPNCSPGLEASLAHRSAGPALQTKHASHTGGVLTDDNIKDVTKIPSSPTSKHNNNTKVTGHPLISENKHMRVLVLSLTRFPPCFR